jgi:hypothetical protein
VEVRDRKTRQIKRREEYYIPRDEWLIGLCPVGKVGDRLRVKEAWAPRLDVDPVEEPKKARRYTLYRSSGTSLDELHWHPYPRRWRPANHCPPWASRFVVEVERVEIDNAASLWAWIVTLKLADASDPAPEAP